ncbi:MAG: choice-of-anchor V domain-containing protein, partial [Bryobacteraceae bacterium]
MRQKLFYSLLGALPVALLAYSTGPPPKRTGTDADGGGNCSACHRTYAPANSDTRGSVRIDAANYVPGVKQTIKVTVQHPEAARWGFEITARMVSDETKIAGEFASNSVVRVICDDGSARGSLAPCQPSQLEFAEHFDAPRTDPGAGFTFSVDWTPPATDVGDVVFYAAGNAANGDGTPTGDRIYTTQRRISPPCNLTQKPVVTSVVNGASFQAPWNTGALISVFGRNFGPAGAKRTVSGADLVSQQVPQSLACMAVTLNGQHAPDVYVQPDQITLQAPTLAGVGPVN